MYAIRHTLFCILLLTCGINAFAQSSKPDESERRRWISEVRNFKHEFLSKELNLSKEQQQAFFPLYDEMEDRIEKLNADTRAIERDVLDNKEADAATLDSVAAISYRIKHDESNIEMEYFDRFRTILHSRQLIRLQSAERRFTQQLMLHHRRIKADKPRKQP